MAILNRLFDRKKPGISYGKRTGIYIIAFDNNGRIPMAKTTRGYFLLGGGLELGESHIDCVKRECMEEAGVNVRVGDLICRSERYHYAVRFKRHMHSISYFYFGEILDKVAEPTETNHELVWLSAGDCYEKLFLAHQRWAVSFAVEKYKGAMSAPQKENGVRLEAAGQSDIDKV